jgi:hypothetical protein
MRSSLRPSPPHDAREPALVTPPSLFERLLWICPIVSVAAIAVFLWVFGLGLWTAVAAGLLLGCPIALAWALVAARRAKLQPLRHGDQ